MAMSESASSCLLLSVVFFLAVTSWAQAPCSEHFCERVIRRLSASSRSSVVIFQEDILIPLPSPGNRAARSLLSSPTRLWPSAVIPYTFHGFIAAALRERFREAMQKWAELTCLRFVERTTEEDYIVLAQDDRSCASYLGRVGGPQRVTIGNGCRLLGNALHELGHAIGLGHEHSRPDRGDFISILWDNVRAASCSNFCKFRRTTVDSRGSPYDYGSIMHYGSQAFGVGGAATIVPGNRSALAVMGQRTALSTQDAAQVRLIYGCPTHPSATPPGGSTATPPGGGTATPPGGGTDTPPGGSTDTPPGGSTATPPGGSTATPPGGSTATPPGGSTDTPPGGSTDTPPGGSTDTPPETPSTSVSPTPSPSWINGSYIVLRGSGTEQYMACHVVLGRCYMVPCRCGQCGNDEFLITSLNGSQVHSGDHITLHIDKGGNHRFLACDITRGCSLQSSEVGVVRSCRSKETYIILSSVRRHGDVIRSGDPVTLQLCSNPGLSIACGRKRCSLDRPTMFTILSRASCS